jgi:hypothetical protein
MVHFPQRGDVIALMMENKAKYVAYVIGLAKIGVTVALINFHLRQEVQTTIVRASRAPSSGTVIVGEKMSCWALGLPPGPPDIDGGGSLSVGNLKPPRSRCKQKRIKLWEIVPNKSVDVILTLSLLFPFSVSTLGKSTLFPSSILFITILMLIVS